MKRSKKTSNIPDDLKDQEWAQRATFLSDEDISSDTNNADG